MTRFRRRILAITAANYYEVWSINTTSTRLKTFHREYANKNDKISLSKCVPEHGNADPRKYNYYYYLLLSLI